MQSIGGIFFGLFLGFLLFDTISNKTIEEVNSLIRKKKNDSDPEPMSED
jgi:hypothetical protein